MLGNLIDGGRMSRLIVLLSLFLMPLAALSEELPKPNAADRAEVISVIESQVDAFRRDDAAAAFSLASPGIRAAFGDAQTFLAAVAAQYQPVYRPRQLKFLELAQVDDQWVQRVLVVGPKGEFVTALYPMVKIDGQWRTNGCFSVPSLGQGI